MFAESAARFAAKTAIVQGDRGTSYGELHAMAGCHAGRLREAGVQPGDMVAISARPSLEMVAAQLGILLAGAAYVPVDPDYPAERAAVLLEECGARVALIGAGCGGNFAGWNGAMLSRLIMADARRAGASPARRAYGQITRPMFSSPRARPGDRRASWCRIARWSRLVQGNGFLAHQAGRCFPAGRARFLRRLLLEIWGSLLNGGLLVIPSNGLALDIAGHAAVHGVTNLWLTSGLFQADDRRASRGPEGVKYIIAGGEIMSVAHARHALEALPDTVLLNGYGPTENTTFTTTACDEDVGPRFAVYTHRQANSQFVGLLFSTNSGGPCRPVCRVNCTAAAMAWRSAISGVRT